MLNLDVLGKVILLEEEAKLKKVMKLIAVMMMKKMKKLFLNT
jgi:hypothetical protein